MTPFSNFLRNPTESGHEFLFLKKEEATSRKKRVLNVLYNYFIPVSSWVQYINGLNSGSRKIPPTKIPPTKIPPTKIPPTKIPPTKIPPTKIPPSENSTHENSTQRKFHPRKIPPQQ